MPLNILGGTAETAISVFDLSPRFSAKMRLFIWFAFTGEALSLIKNL